MVDGLQQPVRARGLVRAAEQWADAGCTGGVGGWSCPWEWGCPELVLRAACHGSCQAIVVGAVVGCWSSWVGVWPVFAARQAHSPFGVLARRCVRALPATQVVAASDYVMLHNFPFLSLLT